MKRALVISGGGSKGAFAVGVLKQMHATYPALDFDIYVGTSAGSLVVSLASLNKFEQLENVYTSISNASLFIEGNIASRINDTALFDVTPAWKLIQNNYPDSYFDQLIASGKKMFINAVCLQTEELNVFTNDASAIIPTNYNVVQTIDANHFRRAILASGCEPIFMPPIQVARDVEGAANPGYQYVDGGVLKYIGIQMALDAGATEIIAIILSAEETAVDPTILTSLIQILGKTVDIFTKDVGDTDIAITDQYASALQYIADVKSKMLAAGISQATIDNYFTVGGSNIFQNKEPVRIFKIRPKEPLGGGPGGLIFDPAEMKIMVTKGEAAFSDFIQSLPPGSINWA